MNILIGNTGFVGKNLKEQIKFDFEFNSSNIKDLANCPPGCNLFLSCLPAAKWLINQNIYQDIININQIIEIIKQNNYNNVYLISTIDVYSASPAEVTENYNPNFSSLNYGSNRLFFEYLCREVLECKNFYVFRLPAVFGKFLKKNIIFDLIHNNQLEKINITSYYQWYDISDLSSDINKLSTSESSTYNLFPEPISTKDLIKIFALDQNVGYEGDLISYNFKTKHTTTGYIYNKETSLTKIKTFLQTTTSLIK